MVTLTLNGHAPPVAGTISSESGDTLILTQINGETLTVDKSTISDEQRMDVSSMPPMSGVLSLSEIRDVVKYLSTLTAN